VQQADQLNGTITNNSTQKIFSVAVYAALYDKDNKLISMVSGFVDASPLLPQAHSSFSTTILGLGNETVDHYTIFPGGLPGNG